MLEEVSDETFGLVDDDALRELVVTLRARRPKPVMVEDGPS